MGSGLLPSRGRLGYPRAADRHPHRAEDPAGRHHRAGAGGARRRERRRGGARLRSAHDRRRDDQRGRRPARRPRPRGGAPEDRRRRLAVAARRGSRRPERAVARARLADRAAGARPARRAASSGSGAGRGSSSASSTGRATGTSSSPRSRSSAKSRSRGSAFGPMLFRPGAASIVGFHEPKECHMASDTLTVTDNRTGLTYELPIEDGAIRAPDLRQIKVSDDDFGLMSYDPAFLNTASCRSAITYIDGDRGILRYRGYPIEQLAEHGDVPRDRVPADPRRAADRGRARGVDARDHLPHARPREREVADGGLPLRRAPDGDARQRAGRAVDLLPGGLAGGQPARPPRRRSTG